jgi:hypothetical protein
VTLTTAAATTLTTTTTTATVVALAAVSMGLSAAVTARGRCCTSRAGAHSAAIGRRCAAVITAAAAHSAAPTTVATVGDSARTAMIAASAFTAEAMPAPAMAIAPAAPRAHAQEDAVVEVSRPVITHGRALVRRVAVVTVRTDGLNADIDVDLRASRRRQGQAHSNDQCCCAEENFKSAHLTPLLRCLRFLVVRGMPCSRKEQTCNSGSHKDLH